MLTHQNIGTVECGIAAFLDQGRGYMANTTKSVIDHTDPEFTAQLLAEWLGIEVSVATLPNDFVVSGTTIWGEADIPEAVADIVGFDSVTNEVLYRTTDGWWQAPQGSFIAFRWLEGQGLVASYVPNWHELIEGDPVRDAYRLMPVPVALCTPMRPEVLGRLEMEAANLWMDLDGVWNYQTPYGVEKLEDGDLLAIIRFWEEPATLEGFVVKRDTELARRLIPTKLVAPTSVAAY